MKSTAVRRLPLAMVACLVLAGAVIWMTAAAPAGASAAFSPRLTDVEQPVEKIDPDESAPYTVAETPKRATKIAKPKAKAVSRPASTQRPVAKKSRAQSTKTSAKTATAPKAKQAASKSSTGSDLTRAQSILRSYIGKYPILKGSTVSFGDARGHQAICYYGSGRIVISKTHKASLERIIAHEIWHIIDWRDNGKINWGESLPPKNASSYVGK